MADKKISAMDPATTPLAGTELVPMVQGGVNVVATVNDIVAKDTDPVTSVNLLTGDVTLTQDNVGDGTTYKQYSQTEKTKLAGIATGATANSSDAALLNRSNHTGTQTASTISDFDTATDARITSAVGVSVQGYDADLQAIGALSPSNDDIIQRKAGAWVSRTMVQLKTDLALTKSDVGLANVDNTSDANKPISTSTQAALDNKAGATHTHGGSEISIDSSGTSNFSATDVQQFVEEVDGLVGSGGGISEEMAIALATAL